MLGHVSVNELRVVILVAKALSERKALSVVDSTALQYTKNALNLSYTLQGV